MGWVEDALEDFKRGDGYTPIARRYGVTRQAVKQAMDKRGMPPRPSPILTAKEILERGLRGNEAPDACWEWQRSRTPPGYGRVSGHRYAHRLAYEVYVGPIPEGLFVLHTCDNPPCCNPAHLCLGTQGDNMADRDAKGRNQGLPKMREIRAKRFGPGHPASAHRSAHTHASQQPDELHHRP